MPTLRLNDQSYDCQSSETVLSALLRQGVSVPHACREGVCQTCMVQSLDGPPPPRSQTGLKDTLKAQNYFLPCVCVPENDLALALPNQAAQRVPVTVHALERLSRDIIRLILQCRESVDFRAGQFIRLYREDGVGRSYSIANLPDPSHQIELHIRRLPGGTFSEWLHTRLTVGDTLFVEGPAGNCFYLPDQKDRGILLIGTGSGLAPLLGIMHDALRQGHSGPIHLFHGSRETEGLYLVDDLRGLVQRHPNITYTPCVSGHVAPPGFAAGRAHDVALATFRDLKEWRLFLCGHPQMVQEARKKAYLAGAALQNIYADAFYSTVTQAQ